MCKSQEMLVLPLLAFHLLERYSIVPTISPHRSDIRQSTLLSKVTHTASETAAYEFTTLTVGRLE
jgi:hypothetical protein